MNRRTRQATFDVYGSPPILTTTGVEREWAIGQTNREKTVPSLSTFSTKGFPAFLFAEILYSAVPI